MTGRDPAREITSRTEVEALIGSIWAELLEREDIAPDQNFFDAGGDSMRLLQMRADLSSALGRDVRVRELMEFPTIRSLAEHLGTARGDR